MNYPIWIPRLRHRLPEDVDIQYKCALIVFADDTAFLCEVQQGGIFSASEMEAGQLAHCLGAFCPNILFPYARETISSLVVKGTFPQLNLAPVNFDALFMNYLQNQAQQAEGEQA